MPESSNLHYVPARIVGARMGTPADPDLAIINERFVSPEFPLTAEQVFTFDAIVSSDAVDSYYTVMDRETTLPNYVSDLIDGKGLQESHDTEELSVGTSFRAELQPVPGGLLEGVPASVQVYAGYYLLRHHRINDGPMTTEDYRTAIIGGRIRRMSIGFGGNDIAYICDIDGSDLFSDDTNYYPGQRLRDGRVVTYTIKNARALETSMVFMNGSPGALIQRMQALVDQRQIPPKEVDRLESSWGVRFVGKPAQHFTGGVQLMDEKQIKEVLDGVKTRAGKKLSAATREKLSGAVKSAEDLIGLLSGLLEETADELEEGRTIRTELGDSATLEGVRVLKINAVAGETYRKDMIAETVKARVAVMGDGFDATRYEKRLNSFDLDDLKDERDTWAAQRSATYKGGRLVPALQVGAESGDSEFFEEE